MKTTDLLCYLNFAEACILHAAIKREVESGNLTEFAVNEAKEFLALMENPKAGIYPVESLPAFKLESR